MKTGTFARLIIFYLAGFLAAFNENTTSPILVETMEQFSISSATANWLVTGYMIVTAIAVTTSAYLCSRFTLKQIVMAGGTLMALSCAGSIVAPTFEILLVSRVIQAFGSGVFIPLMMTAVFAYAPKNRVGTYLSIGTGIVSSGPALAPAISGAMATAFGWRAVFIIPIIMGVLVVIGGLLLVRGSLSEEKTAIDVLSLLLISMFVVALVGATAACSENLWLALGLFGLAAVGLWLFVWRQRHAKNPLLKLGPFKSFAFDGSCAVVFCMMMIIFSMSVMLMLYYQASLGMTAFLAGLLVFIPALVDAVAGFVAGRFYDRYGAWPLLPAAIACIVIGQAVVFIGAFMVSVPVIIAGTLFTFGGIGFAFPIAQTFGLSSLPANENPSGVSLINLVAQVAASVGPALFVGIISAIASPVLETPAYPAMLSQGFATSVLVSTAIALALCLFSIYLVRRGRAS